jgi:hypothetical protein
MSLIQSKIVGGESELTDVNPGGAKLTDTELDAVTGGNMIIAKNDMMKGLIQNYRV